MNIKRMFFRDKQEVGVDSYECWEVRWQSRYDQYSGCLRPEVRAFPSKEGASEFALALETAFKLIKHTSGNKVSISKQED